MFLQVLGLDPLDPTLFFRAGGTSAGTPQWAALIALADQLAGHRLGLVNDDLYGFARSSHTYARTFHDIRSGTNDFAGIEGYETSRVWDPVTGLGSPRANALVPLLAATGH